MAKTAAPKPETDERLKRIWSHRKNVALLRRAVLDARDRLKGLKEQLRDAEHDLYAAVVDSESPNLFTPDPAEVDE